MMSNKSQDNNIKNIGIIWFRNDLRLHDNLILNTTIESIKENTSQTLLFCALKEATSCYIFMWKSFLQSELKRH